MAIGAESALPVLGSDILIRLLWRSCDTVRRNLGRGAIARPNDDGRSWEFKFTVVRDRSVGELERAL